MRPVLQNRTLFLYCAGSLILGVTGLIVGDFALQWQPVPAGVPLRTLFAYASNAILVVLAAATVMPKVSTKAIGALAAFYFAWALLLHVPRVAVEPANVSIWLGLAEILAIAVAGGIAWLTTQPDSMQRRWLRIGQYVFGGCLVVFGSSHFVYADFTATMIPKWLPFSLFWAYLTGAGHLAAGISLLSGIATRLATTLLTAMFACFVLLLHLPRVLADPTSHVEWVMLGIATTITGAAWIVRASLSPTRHHTPGTRQ